MLVRLGKRRVGALSRAVAPTHPRPVPPKPPHPEGGIDSRGSLGMRHAALRSADVRQLRMFALARYCLRFGRNGGRRMRASLFLAALAALIAGCSTTARLYPVEGPLSQLVPAPVIAATIRGIEGNNGSLSFVLPSGAACQGEWSSAAGVETTFAAGSLFSQYGAAHGSGYAIRSGGGQNPGRAIATCADGSRFDIEFVTGGGTASGFGFARDNQGNVYRVLF